MNEELDLIDRNKLYNQIRLYLNRPSLGETVVWTTLIANDITSIIADMPTVEPVRHGKWENYPSHTHRRCSLCKMEWEKPRFNIRANYCPNCGARMEGE